MMMKNKNLKKGQVTIFVIVAILIVAVIGLFFVFRGKTNLGSVDSEVEPIHNFVVGCIEETGENALQRIGEQGGYFFIPDNNPSIESKIPYYIYDGQSHMPEITEIENSLSGFVYEELSFCILNFKDFRNGFEIEHELEDVKTEIKDGEVVFSLDYPVYLTKGDKSFELKGFESIRIPVRLDVIYNTASEMISEQQTHLDSICLSCLYDLGEKNDVNIDMLDYGEDTTIFTIIDDDLKINKEAYEFNFAVQYE